MTFIDKLCLEKCINIENENSYPLHWLDQSTELRTGTAGTCFSRTFSLVSCAQRLSGGMCGGVLLGAWKMAYCSVKPWKGPRQKSQFMAILNHCNDKWSYQKKHLSHLLSCHEIFKSRQTHRWLTSQNVSCGTKYLAVCWLLNCNKVFMPCDCIKGYFGLFFKVDNKQVLRTGLLS